MMLKIIKDLFIPEKDYAGRAIDDVIYRLASQTGTQYSDWSYIVDDKVYENTVSGMKIHPHETDRRVA